MGEQQPEDSSAPLAAGLQCPSVLLVSPPWGRNQVKAHRFLNELLKVLFVQHGRPHIVARLFLGHAWPLAFVRDYDLTSLALHRAAARCVFIFLHASKSIRGLCIVGFLIYPGELCMLV